MTSTYKLNDLIFVELPFFSQNVSRHESYGSGLVLCFIFDCMDNLIITYFLVVVFVLLYLSSLIVYYRSCPTFRQETEMELLCFVSEYVVNLTKTKVTGGYTW